MGPRGPRRDAFTSALPDPSRGAAPPPQIGSAARLDRRLGLGPATIEHQGRPAWCRPADDDAAAAVDVLDGGHGQGFGGGAPPEQRQGPPRPLLRPPPPPRGLPVDRNPGGPAAQP